jgi:transposase-like protein
MCPYSYYSVMRTSKDPKYLRLQMVLAAEEHGIRYAAKHFRTSRNTVRKWLDRWHEHGYAGLESLSRRPHRSPGATPAHERRRPVRLKRHRSGGTRGVAPEPLVDGLVGNPQVGFESRWGRHSVPAS